MTTLSADITIPAIAASSASAAPIVPDLASQFDDVYRRCVEQIRRDELSQQDFDRHIELVTGIARANAPGWDEPGFDAYEAASHAILSERVGGPDSGADEVWTELNRERLGICREILRSGCRTTSDLALHARAYALINFEMWTSPEDFTEQDLEGRLVVDSLCSFLSIDPLPGVLVKPATGAQDE